MDNKLTDKEEMIKLSFDFLKQISLMRFRKEISSNEYKSMKANKLQFLRSCRVWL